MHMLKKYKVGELTYQFEEGEQPAGAVEVKSAKAAAKAVKPADKARKTTTK